jgi:hypothetical protein
VVLGNYDSREGILRHSCNWLLALGARRSVGLDVGCEVGGDSKVETAKRVESKGRQRDCF